MSLLTAELVKRAQRERKTFRLNMSGECCRRQAGRRDVDVVDDNKRKL